MEARDSDPNALVLRSDEAGEAREAQASEVQRARRR